MVISARNVAMNSFSSLDVSDLHLAKLREQSCVPHLFECTLNSSLISKIVSWLLDYCKIDLHAALTRPLKIQGTVSFCEAFHVHRNLRFRRHDDGVKYAMPHMSVAYTVVWRYRKIRSSWKGHISIIHKLYWNIPQIKNKPNLFILNRRAAKKSTFLQPSNYLHSFEVKSLRYSIESPNKETYHQNILNKI